MYTIKSLDTINDTAILGNFIFLVKDKIKAPLFLPFSHGIVTSVVTFY